MRVSPELLAWLQDLLGSLGPVRAKSMFGGAGVYVGELMIGLLDRDEVLYLRVDEATRPDFEATGSSPFSYVRNGEAFSIPYWRAPDEALDGPDSAAAWGRLAMDAALRKAQARRRKTGDGVTRARAPARRTGS